MRNLFLYPDLVGALVARELRVRYRRSTIGFVDPIYQGEVPPVTGRSVAVAIAMLALALGAWTFRRSSDRISFYV